MSEQPQALDGGALLRFVYTCPIGIVLTDARGGIRVLSGKATALLIPYSPDGALNNLFAFVARWDETAAAALRRLVGARVAQPLVQRLHVTAPGTPEQWLELHAVPFDDGLSVACRDVTALVKQEEELLALATEEAEQRGRAEMAAGVLHDMGNALTAMGGQSVTMRALLEREQVMQSLERLTVFLREHEDALEGVLGPGKGRGVIELLRAMHRTYTDIRAELFETLRVLNAYLSHAQELLSINRTYARAATAAEPAELGRIIRDVRDMTRGAIGKRKGTMEIRLPEQVSRVAADRSKLIQILLNLIKNGIEAWDSAPDQPLCIELTARAGGDGGLVIEVRDNGCGFAGDGAETFFERDASSKGRDSGVGLYSCRRLAESMGGRLTLSSPGPGEGALATLYLPPGMVRHESDT